MKNPLKLEINQNRIYGLDILRAFAILFVVIGHGNLLLPISLQVYSSWLIFDGVTIFFVLSGYLIGGILIKKLINSPITFRTLLDFWLRRWLRTIPNYMLVLCTLIGINIVLNPNFELQKTVSYFIFSQNLFYPHPFFFPEAWSLSVEEWFYLIIPCFIFLLAGYFKIGNKKAIFIPALGVLITISCFRLYRYNVLSIDNAIEWDAYFRKQVITRLDSIMYGVIGAYIAYYHKHYWSKYKWFLFILGVVILVGERIISEIVFLEFGVYQCIFSFSIISLGTLFLIPYLSEIQNGKGVLFKCFTYLSLISYSMYLINLTIFFFIRDWFNLGVFDNSHMLKYKLFWIVTIILSICLYKYFEKPIMNKRDKWIK